MFHHDEPAHVEVGPELWEPWRTKARWFDFIVGNTLTRDLELAEREPTRDNLSSCRYCAP